MKSPSTILESKFRRLAFSGLVALIVALAFGGIRAFSFYNSIRTVSGLGMSPEQARDEFFLGWLLFGIALSVSMILVQLALEYLPWRVSWRLILPQLLLSWIVLIVLVALLYWPLYEMFIPHIENMTREDDPPMRWLLLAAPFLVLGVARFRPMNRINKMRA